MVYPQTYLEQYGFAPQKAPNTRSFVMGHTSDQEKLVNVLFELKDQENVHWVLSSQQWSEKTMYGQAKRNQFTDFLRANHVNIAPRRDCPVPFVRTEGAFDVIVLDTNWFLQQSNAQFVDPNCPYRSMDEYYWMVERAMINAQQRPLLILSHHSPLPKAFLKKNQESFYKKVTDLVGASGIANPAYQDFRERFLNYIQERPNTAVVSMINGPTQLIREKNFHHVGLEQGSADWVEVKSHKNELHIFVHAKKTKIIRLTPQPRRTFKEKPCSTYQGHLHDFQEVGGFEQFFLGENYRDLWRQQVKFPCFDLRRSGYDIKQVLGKRSSILFEIHHPKEGTFVLMPLQRKVDLPNLLKNTIVEKVYRNYRSAYHPMGYLLSNELRKHAKLPYVDMELVYMDTHQDVFRDYDKTFDEGFYLKIKTYPRWLGKDLHQESIDSYDVIHRVETKPHNHIDQRLYLKTMLFDVLVGDWERGPDRWQWLSFNHGRQHVFVPISWDQKAAFYDGDGSVFWWARRKWLQFDWQDYEKTLKKPESLLVHSYDMDRRYTSHLESEMWEVLAKEIQFELSLKTFSKAMSTLPVEISEQEKSVLLSGFEHRLSRLPQYAVDLRSTINKTKDVMGTSSRDLITFYNKYDAFHVKVQNRNRTLMDQPFEKSDTPEIRVFGLEGKDQINIRATPPNGMKVRLIPGGQNDRVEIDPSIQRPRGYKLFVEKNKRVDAPKKMSKRRYYPQYNALYSQAHGHKMDYWEPTTFFASSSPDTSLMFGGGVRYNHAGFQKQPWQSTHEFKFNTLFRRTAFNVYYNSNFYDLLGLSDLMTYVDVGVPRFYGLFFGLGNESLQSVSSEDNRFYWLRGYHLQQKATLDIPVSEQFSFKPTLQFRIRDFIVEDNSFINDPSENNLDAILGPGTNDNMFRPNYYPAAGLRVEYNLTDEVSGPVKKRSLRLYAQWLTHVGLESTDGIFHQLNLHVDTTGYVRKSKTQWKLALGYGKNYGDWEFFDAQFLGQNSYLRGFTSNRFGGESKVYASFEVNQSLVFKNRPIFTDIGLGPYLDQGRVYIDPDPTSDGKWHVVLGAQAYTVLLKTIALKAGYGYPINDVENGIFTFEITTEI